MVGNGWKFGLTDPPAEPTDAQTKRIDELTTWLKNPNPSKRFYRLLYELVEHLGYLRRTRAMPWEFGSSVTDEANPSPLSDHSLQKASTPRLASKTPR